MTMAEHVLRYDEAHLMVALSKLPPLARTAFAAACAERMLPVYRWFHQRTGRGDPVALRRALADVWTSLDSDSAESLEAQRAVAEGLVPEEDDMWVDECAYAENAAASVSYAISARLTGSTKEAVAAAFQVYEALDYRVTNRDDVDLNLPGAEEQVVSDPLIQLELIRQQANIEELKQAVENDTLEAATAQLRRRAQVDGRTVFDFQLV